MHVPGSSSSHEAKRLFWVARASASARGLWILLAVAAILCAVNAISAEQQFRFPPPDFESGYKLPETTTPGPRTLLNQYVDVAVLLISLGLASYWALKKRSRKALLGLSVFSVLYFGFYRQGCVCAIGSVQNVALALGDRSYAVPGAVLAFFLAPLVFALFFGRTFCAAVCPHGALQDLVLLKPLKVPAWLEQGLGVLPYIYLGAGILFAATGSAFIICNYDPIVPFFRFGGSWPMLAAGGALLVLAMFVGRPYCRFLCPYGALLRLAGTVSKWRVRVTPDFCTQCRLCEESCPYGAMREPANAPLTPTVLAVERRRLSWLALSLPVLVLGCGWIGSQLAVPASRVHPAVELAEHYQRQQQSPVVYPPQTAPSLSLQRVDADPKPVLTRALEIRQRFGLGGWLLGGWVGLVIGAKMISLSVRRHRTDYEPDRGACVACARCFASCPNERVRLGLSLEPVLAQAKPPAEPVLAERS